MSKESRRCNRWHRRFWILIAIAVRVPLVIAGQDHQAFATVYDSGERSPAAGRPRFELIVLARWLWLNSETEASLAAVRSASTRRPLFVVRAEDVETYVWKTQRITLTRGASARLSAALLAANSELRGGLSADEDLGRDLYARAFQVRVNGEFLYGGVFEGRGNAMHRPYPVCHFEWVGGQAIFYLLPMQMNPQRLDEYEETVGASRFFMRYARPPALPADFHEDPTVLRFRTVLRDSRVQALFASLGKLVPEPPPPTTPEEIRTALIQTDAEVHRRYASGSKSIEPLLKESYVLHYMHEGEEDCLREPPSRVCNRDDKQAVLESMVAGRWNLDFYAVPAVQAPEFTGERSATIRSLIVMRVKCGSSYALGELRSPPWGPWEPFDRVIVSTRRYEFNSPAWQLADEVHETCGYVLSEHAIIAEDTLAHCWPPRRPT